MEQISRKFRTFWITNCWISSNYFAKFWIPHSMRFVACSELNVFSIFLAGECSKIDFLLLSCLSLSLVSWWKVKYVFPFFSAFRAQDCEFFFFSSLSQYCVQNRSKCFKIFNEFPPNSKASSKKFNIFPKFKIQQKNLYCIPISPSLSRLHRLNFLFELIFIFVLWLCSHIKRHILLTFPNINFFTSSFADTTLLSSKALGRGLLLMPSFRLPKFQSWEGKFVVYKPRNYMMKKNLLEFLSSIARQEDTAFVSSVNSLWFNPGTNRILIVANFFIKIFLWQMI